MSTTEVRRDDPSEIVSVTAEGYLIDWPSWYTAYTVAEQDGSEMST